MKRILSLLAIPLTLALVATPVMAQAALPYETDLITDGGEERDNVGSLSVGDDGTIVYAIDEDATDWRLAKAHLYVGDEPPAKHAPGRFPHHSGDLDGVLTYEFMVELEGDEDGIVYIAAHAELIMEVGVDEDGEPIYAYETAWAQAEVQDEDSIDEPIGKGRNWATYFTVDASEPDDDPNDDA